MKPLILPISFHVPSGDMVPFCETKGCLALIHADQKKDEEWLHCLSVEEKSVFEKYQHSARKKSYLLGRYCAKQAISHIIDIPCLSSITILTGFFRHPLIRGISQTGLCITIAHSKNAALALVHFDTYPCGVDLEIVDAIPKETIYPLLTKNEQVILAENFVCENEGIALAWCAKESLAKAVKTGLTLPFSFLEIQTIEKKPQYHEVLYKHFLQYSSINFMFQGMMLSITKPKTVIIYGLEDAFCS